MSSSTTRTGLVPTPKRGLKIIPKQRKPVTECLPAEFEAMPIALSLRPFGGIYNPYAKSCSVLCNHPAPTAVKNIIHQVKSTLATEAKSAQHQQQKDNVVDTGEGDDDGHDNIPEDLFRRYKDADSRPLTPSPTVTSVRTRTSAGSFLNNRRCITPELGKNEIIKRKKIILDLRRSHSQETLYWKPSSDISQSATDNDSKPKPKSASAGAYDENKPKRQKSEDQQRPKSSVATITTSTSIAAQENFDCCDGGVVAKKIQTCINEHQLDDEDVRRGKKRKKMKPTPAAPTTATFHLSEDPETQVATLGPDSVNPSTRPSLIPNAISSLLPNKDKRESEPVLLKGSFLTDDAFQALKTELDVDVIENTFGRYLNRALREAIKFIPPKGKSSNSVQQISPKTSPTELDKKFAFTTETKMPRKFSKSATRFDVPLDLKSLESMSVLDYLSKYVWVSRQRKNLYKRSFLKYVADNVDDMDESGINVPVSHISASPDGMQSELEEDSKSAVVCTAPYRERTMPVQCLRQALEDVLEFHGTEKNINTLLEFLHDDMLKSEFLDFRTWCGVVSFAERLALDDPNCTDSCDELEKADFSSMEQRLNQINVPPLLKRVFEVIRRTHNLHY